MGIIDFLTRALATPRYRIFISYARKHSKVANAIYFLLHTNRYTFLDVVDLEPGENWQERIEKEIRSCTHFYILWCKHADESKFVQQEIEVAIARRKKIVPIIIGCYPLPQRLAVFHGLTDTFTAFCVEEDEDLTRATEALVKAAESRLYADWRQDLQRVQRNRGTAAAFVAFMAIIPALIPRYQPVPASDLHAPAASRRSVEVAAPGMHFRDCADCPEMVVVPAGKFLMGSPPNESARENAERPVHAVAIAKPLAVGRFSITFAEWDACVADGGCGGYRPEDEGWGRGSRPVINVSWEDANAYTHWLSVKVGKSYRLLTESEREYVTRAGTATPYWWGSSIRPDQANYLGSNKSEALPVDSFAPNPFGLYQVHGNVWDWVDDCWHDTYQGAPTDGSPWTTGPCSLRVLRGGSWGSSPDALRADHRATLAPDYRASKVGFRVAREITP